MNSAISDNNASSNKTYKNPTYLPLETRTSIGAENIKKAMISDLSACGSFHLRETCDRITENKLRG